MVDHPRASWWTIIQAIGRPASELLVDHHPGYWSTNLRALGRPFSRPLVDHPPRSWLTILQALGWPSSGLLSWSTIHPQTTNHPPQEPGGLLIKRVLTKTHQCVIHIIIGSGAGSKPNSTRNTWWLDPNPNLILNKGLRNCRYWCVLVCGRFSSYSEPSPLLTTSSTNGL